MSSRPIEPGGPATPPAAVVLTEGDRSEAAQPSPPAEVDRFQPGDLEPDILGARHRHGAELGALRDALLKRADETAALFPEASHPGFAEALKESTRRVTGALDAGSITADEAADALEMMREMMEATADLKAGNVRIVRADQHDLHVHHWELESPDGDRFAVTTRRFREEEGDPRIGLRMLADDGEKLPGRHRMSMRLDLERWGQASVDVQFGSSGLDRRIHGLMKNEDGSDFLTESGKKLADHHFKKNLPDSMEDPEVFAKLVKDFVEGRMDGFKIRQDPR